MEVCFAYMVGRHDEGQFQEVFVRDFEQTAFCVQYGIVLFSRSKDVGGKVPPTVVEHVKGFFLDVYGRRF